MLFTLWGMATISMIVALVIAVKKAIRMQIVVDKDGDGVQSVQERMDAYHERLSGFFHALSDMSIIGSAMRFMLIFIPWPFFNGVRAQIAIAAAPLRTTSFQNAPAPAHRYTHASSHTACALFEAVSRSPLTFSHFADFHHLLGLLRF